MTSFESFDKFGEFFRAIVISFSLSVTLFFISLSMRSSYGEKISFKIGFLILLFLVGFLIFLILSFISLNAHVVKYWIPDTTDKTRGDLANWAAIVIDVGIGVFISGMIFLYDRERKRKTIELEKSRTISEHQHYKERLLRELDRLVSLTSTIISLYGNTTQIESNEKNISHANRSLEKITTINSIFKSPSEIRSKLDRLMSEYDGILEGAQHRCLILGDPNAMNLSLAKQVQEFLNHEFFKGKNNEFIDSEFKKLQQTLSGIMKS